MTLGRGHVAKEGVSPRAVILYGNNYRDAVLPSSSETSTGFITKVSTQGWRSLSLCAHSAESAKCYVMRVTPPLVEFGAV